MSTTKPMLCSPISSEVNIVRMFKAPLAISQSLHERRQHQHLIRIGKIIGYGFVMDMYKYNKSETPVKVSVPSTCLNYKMRGP